MAQTEERPAANDAVTQRAGDALRLLEERRCTVDVLAVVDHQPAHRERPSQPRPVAEFPPEGHASIQPDLRHREVAEQERQIPRTGECLRQERRGLVHVRHRQKPL